MCVSPSEIRAMGRVFGLVYIPRAEIPAPALSIPQPEHIPFAAPSLGKLYRGGWRMESLRKERSAQSRFRKIGKWVMHFWTAHFFYGGETCYSVHLGPREYLCMFLRLHCCTVPFFCTSRNPKISGVTLFLFVCRARIGISNPSFLHSFAPA